MGEPATQPPTKHAYSGIYVRAQPGLKLRDKKVERLARKVRNALSWLEAGDYPAVRAWAELEFLCEQAYATLRAIGVVNHDGDGRRLLKDYRQLRQAQLAYANALGMTPSARQALKASASGMALDLAGMLATESGTETPPADSDGVTPLAAEPESPPRVAAAQPASGPEGSGK